MDKYGKLFDGIIVSLTVFLLFMLFQSLRVTGGGFVSSSEVAVTFPLVVQANISFLAFWGLILVFRIRELSSTRIELVKNLWELGFKRSELKVAIAGAKEGRKKELLDELHEKLGEDSAKTKELIEGFYDWEAMMMYTGLLPAIFFVVSISSGIYGIGVSFHAELVDPITYFTPIVSLFVGVISTIIALFSSTFRVTTSIDRE